MHLVGVFAMRFFLLASFLTTGSLAPIQAQAQANLVVSGVVQDQTGAVFLGAQVHLLRDGKEERTTTTDASGAFSFDNLQPGNYEVRTRKEGFKTDTAKVTVGT